MIKMSKNRERNKNGLVNRIMSKGLVFGALVMLFVATMASVGVVTAADADEGGVYLVTIKDVYLPFATRTGSYPFLNPDWEKVAYISPKAMEKEYAKVALLIMNTDGSDLKGLDEWRTPVFFDEMDGWSPDGKKIIYRKANDSGLWIINSDGSEKMRIADCKIGEGSGDELFIGKAIWSPDGSKIAFDGKGGISVVDSGGSNEEFITSTGWLLDWTLDGKKIFFYERRSEYNNSKGDWEYIYNIWEIDIEDGGILKELTKITTERYYYAPKISPDGSKVTFQNDGIWVANLDRSGSKLLGYGSMPFWSSDSKNIVFISREKGIRGGIWIMNSDGSNQKKIAELSMGFQCWVGWSQGRSKIAYTTYDSENKTSDIYTINVGKLSPIKPPTGETPTEKQPGIPGFEVLFAIAGLLAVTYLLRRRK